MANALDVIKPVFVSTLGTYLTYSALAYLIAQKVCSPRIPDDINGFICHKDDLVALATEISTTRNIVKSISSAIFVGLFGAWRDIKGRSTPLLYLGVVTELLSSAVYIFAALSWSSSVWIPTMIEAAIGGAFGMNLLHLGANCLVISKTTPKERMVKLQIYLVSLALGIIVADSISGPLLNAVGFRWYFFIPVALQAVSLVLLFYFVKEGPSTEERRGLAEIFLRLADLFKPRTNIGVIWLMLICNSLIANYISAEASVAVYYMQQAFGFTVNQTTIYITYNIIINVIGAIIIPIILKRYFNWKGFKLGILSAFMTTVSSIAMTFVKTVVELYLVTLLGLLKYVNYAVPQFILSTIIRSEEIGLFLGFGSIVSIGLPFLGNYLYKYTFSQYHNTWPGAIYFVSAGANFIILLFLSIGYYFYIPKKEEDEENQTTSTYDIEEPINNRNGSAN